MNVSIWRREPYKLPHYHRADIYSLFIIAIMRNYLEDFNRNIKLIDCLLGPLKQSVLESVLDTILHFWPLWYNGFYMLFFLYLISSCPAVLVSEFSDADICQVLHWAGPVSKDPMDGQLVCRHLLHNTGWEIFVHHSWGV